MKILLIELKEIIFHFKKEPSKSDYIETKYAMLIYVPLKISDSHHSEWPPSWISTFLECLSRIFVLYTWQCTSAESFIWCPCFIPNHHVASTRISACIMLIRTAEIFKQLSISVVILVGFN